MAHKNNQLTGILVACPTPFNADYSLDVPGIKTQVDRMIAAGVHGLVPTGSTGEFMHLTDAEYETVIEEFVKAAAGRVPVCPGIGSTSTARAVELAKHAEKVGAEAIMLLPPYYDPPSFESLKIFLKTVADAITIPIMYYNIPGVTGVRLTAEQFAEIGEIDGVNFMKDTSGDAPTLSNLLLTKSDKIEAFNGWDTLTFVGMTLGAKASVWGMAGFMPEVAAELWDVVAVKRDLDKGLALWKKIFPVAAFMESVDYIGAVKAGHDIIGHSAGPSRAPSQPLSAADKATLKSLLQAAGVKTV